ncbi:MAG: TraR/DksA C4-type zinc finger protein [Desulfitobacteriaceae bacterium]
MNINKNERYKTLIETLKQEKQDTLKMASKLLKEDMRESLSELSMIDNHPADIGTGVYERERDVAERDRLKGKIQAIDSALERWEKDEYGVCEHCGQEIPSERLDALPYTTVCLACSRIEETEEQHSFHREPVENQLLNLPFARTFNDHKGQAEFDGEDSWQAVARYGTSDTLQDLGTNKDISDPNGLYEDSDEWIGAVEEIETIPTQSDLGQENSKHYGV